MLILFDHGTPAPLCSFLRDHIVKKTKDLGWDTLNNGELVRAAEEAAFEIFLTTDKNIRYQQNLADRIIAIVVLGNSRWPVLRLYIDRVVAAIAASKPGAYTEVEIQSYVVDQTYRLTRRRRALAFGGAVVSRMINSGGTANSMG
jgi:glutamate racemase